jgi:uncharacterized protein
MAGDDSVHCWIYRSDRKAETYIYLAQQDGKDALAAGLRSVLEPLVFVMELELHAGRVLARADVVTVMEELRSRGFFLQMPPTQVEKLVPVSPTPQ